MKSERGTSTIVAVIAAVVVTAVVVGSVAYILATPPGEPEEPEAKFREIPLEWILSLEENLVTPMTPYGPNDETPTSAAGLQLTDAEKETLKTMEFGEYYFMGATLDMSEILNKVGMDAVLADLEKAPMPFMGCESIDEQIDQVNSLAAKAGDIGFIIAEAYEAVTTGPSFAALSEAGVPQLHNWTTPVGVFGTPNYIGLVDGDGYGLGAATAEIIAYALNYEGEVGAIYFALEQWTNVMIHEGFKDTIAKYPNIELVSEEGFTDPAGCRDIALGMLQAHPEIDAIYASWIQGPATGACEAAIQLGMEHDVVVVAPGSMGTAEAMYVADPNYPFIAGIAADCIDMGKNSTLAAMNWLLGQTELRGGYFVSKSFPYVKANLVDSYYKQTLGAIGPLPAEVLELLQ